MSLLLALQGGGGPATITANLAATEAPDVAAFSAVRLSVGALAATEGQDVASFSATLAHTSALAVVEAQDIAAFSGVLVHVANLAAIEEQDVASFDATLVAPAAVETAPAGKVRDIPRRRYIMPDGHVFIASTQEALALLQLYSVPKESIAQLTAPPQAQPVIRAPQITLEKRDVRFVPADEPNTYKALISERFVYRAPADAYGQAEAAANRIRADEEAILALML